MPNFIKDNMSVSYFSFVPTPSALDYKFGNNILTEEDYQKTYSPVDDAANVPFVNFVAEQIGSADSENNNHIGFSFRNRQFVMNQLSSDVNIQNQKISTSYLCGSKVKIGGENILCDNSPATYTTGFAPTIQWSVLNGSNLIDINGPTNQPQISFTPKTNARGSVKLQAYLAGGGASNTVTKDIWIGKPFAGVAQINDPSYYYKSHFYLSNTNDTPIANQEITNIKWTKLSASDPTVRLYAYDNNTEGYATGPNNYWTMQLKVEITNACGVLSQIVTITPPAAAPCDDYKLVKTSESSDSYVVLRPPNPPCNNLNKGVANSNNNTFNKENENYQIKIANSMGTIVLNKTGNSFDFQSFPAGMYVVNISKDNETIINQTLIKY